MKCIATLILLVFLAGCAPYVYVDYEPGTSYAPYQTFGLEPREAESARNLDDSRVAELSRRHAGMLGMRFLEQGQPDLWLRYGFEENARYTGSGVSLGVGYRTGRYGLGGSTVTNVLETKELYLVMELVSSAENRVVWRATSNRSLTRSLTGASRDARLDQIVREMFAEYPPGQNPR